MQFPLNRWLRWATNNIRDVVILKKYLNGLINVITSMFTNQEIVYLHRTDTNQHVLYSMYRLGSWSRCHQQKAARNMYPVYQPCKVDGHQNYYGCSMKLRAYLMWSSKRSLKSVKFNFYFPDWIYASFAKPPFTTDPIEIGQLIQKIPAVEGLQNISKQRSALFGYI